MAESTPTPPPPEFFANVIRELRRHWVDAAAVDRGIDPAQVDRALIIEASDWLPGPFRREGGAPPGRAGPLHAV